MDGLQIRPATPPDATALFDLLRSERLQEGALDEFLVGERDGEVVASARLVPIPEGGSEITSVAVRPDLRGRDVGTAIVTEILRRAPRPVYAMALAPGFFLKLGFVEVKEVAPSMEKRLGALCDARGGRRMRLDG